MKINLQKTNLVTPDNFHPGKEVRLIFTDKYDETLKSSNIKSLKERMPMPSQNYKAILEKAIHYDKEIASIILKFFNEVGEVKATGFATVATGHLGVYEIKYV